MTSKSKRLSPIRTWFVSLPEIHGADEWDEVEARTAGQAAERAVSDEIRDYDDLECHGGERTIKALVKKSETAKKVQTFSVQAEIDITWEAWEERAP